MQVRGPGPCLPPRSDEKSRESQQQLIERWRKEELAMRLERNAVLEAEAEEEDDESEPF